MTIIVKSLLSPTLVSTYPSNVGKELQKLPLIIKFFITKCAYTRISINSYKQQPQYITSAGKRIRYLVITNTTFNLSKAMSGEGDQNHNVTYVDILLAQKDKNILIIDVRENFEIEETGKLPESVHIPMCEVANALTNLTNEEFEEKFKRKKPTKDTKIVVSCKSGRRSAIIQLDIQKLGYKNVHNYSGGWLDWEQHQKN